MLYRRNRYYKPATGQFTQEDPIGLAGGLNSFGFGNGDPLNFGDPFGLRYCYVGGDANRFDSCMREAASTLGSDIRLTVNGSPTIYRAQAITLQTPLFRRCNATRVFNRKPISGKIYLEGTSHENMNYLRHRLTPGRRGQSWWKLDRIGDPRITDWNTEGDPISMEALYRGDVIIKQGNVREHLTVSGNVDCFRDLGTFEITGNLAR